MSRGAGGREVLAIALLASLAASTVTRPAVAESDAGRADSSGASSSGAPADSVAPRKLLSTDGAIRVYAERRPGEGINGFWWEYDPKPDLQRLLDVAVRFVGLDDKPRERKVLEVCFDAGGHFHLPHGIVGVIIASKRRVFHETHSGNRRR